MEDVTSFITALRLVSKEVRLWKKSREAERRVRKRSLLV